MKKVVFRGRSTTRQGGRWIKLVDGSAQFVGGGCQGLLNSLTAFNLLLAHRVLAAGQYENGGVYENLGHLVGHCHRLSGNVFRFDSSAGLVRRHLA